MDPLKEAFNKVKEEINILKQEINLLKENFSQIRLILEKIDNSPLINTSQNPTNNSKNTTFQHIIPTDNSVSKPLKPENLPVSIGNEGVPTDRQTDRQTNQQTQNNSKNEQKSIIDALEILNSLDNIKKEIHIKFKHLTDQEILIFSTIYQLEEENDFVDYKTISQKLNLSESSIRDYVRKLIKKGIPVDKKKINNKLISLSIPQNFKKLAPLSTILKLREL